MIALLLLLSCKHGPPEVCDGGDEAWAQKAIPLVWGRRPHGAAEVRLWAGVAHDAGRDVAIRAMTGSEEYRARWGDFLTDELAVARKGDRADAPCFGEPLLPDDGGDLARWVATATAGDAYPGAFSMADLIRSSLEADDLSGIWRVHLFAQMHVPLYGANVGPRELERGRRQDFGETFEHTFLHRDLVCLTCHNSEYAVTDDAESDLDRHWPVPGLFELALFGQSAGVGETAAFQAFRYEGVVGGEVSPFGMSSLCGTFTAPDQLPADYLGQDGYFVSSLGAGSVWDLEPLLARGVDVLAADGLHPGEDGAVEGPPAFAWLVAQNFADLVWKEATGERLTIANYFPRNEAQRDRLQALTSTFVASRFSLRELLVAVATNPYFDAGITCGANPYGLDPVVNPWTISEDDETARGNGPGDLVHRNQARVLVRSVHDSMGWPQPATFPAVGDPVLDLQGKLGARLRESEPGFNGTDFQGMLAFEAAYGACAIPTTGGAGDGCMPTLTIGGCASCDCQSCTCSLDPYCCEVQWDDLCVGYCNDTCGGCGGGLSGPQADTLDRLLEAGMQRGSTVGDVAEALRDRLVSNATIAGDERPLVEALVGTSLDTPLAQAGDVEPGLRHLCGALLSSPQFQLVFDPGDAGPIPALALDADADCADATALLAAYGVTPDCGGAP